MLAELCLAGDDDIGNSWSDASRDMMGLFANKNYFLLNALVCIFIKNRSTSGRSISGRELVCTLNFGVNSILVKVAPSSQRMSPSPFSRVHLRGTIFFFFFIKNLFSRHVAGGK